MRVTSRKSKVKCSHPFCPLDNSIVLQLKIRETLVSGNTVTANTHWVCLGHAQTHLQRIDLERQMDKQRYEKAAKP